jgi:hypothetical protein
LSGYTRMSYDYIVWKRSPNTKTAMLTNVYKAICDGKDHPAMAPFDTASLERDLKGAFGDVNSNPDGPFLYSFDLENASPWLSICVNYSQVNAVTDKIVALALHHGLMVYDPQRGIVWGNKRT